MNSRMPNINQGNSTVIGIPPVTKDATIEVKKATLKEPAKRKRTMYRETNPYSWTKQRFSRDKKEFTVGELLLKEHALYVMGKIGDTEVDKLLNSECKLSLISLEV